MVACVPFLLGVVPLSALIYCCCCCFMYIKQNLALWMELPEPILAELGIPPRNTCLLTMPKRLTPGQLFEGETRDGRIITFTVTKEERVPLMGEPDGVIRRPRPEHTLNEPLGNSYPQQGYCSPQPANVQEVAIARAGARTAQPSPTFRPARRRLHHQPCTLHQPSRAYPR